MSCHKCGYFEGHDDDCPTVISPDHGISPAQLIERVERITGLREPPADITHPTTLGSLQDDVDELREKVEALEKRLDACVANMFRDYDSRLDAALKRIESLEFALCEERAVSDAALRHIKELEKALAM